MYVVQHFKLYRVADHQGLDAFLPDPLEEKSCPSPGAQ